MLGILRENSTETGKYLVNVVKTLKIPEYSIDIFKEVVSLICGVVSHLKNMVYAIVQSVFPEKIASYLLDAFKTTSAT